MIVSFDTAAELVADLTDDIPTLEKGIQTCGPAAARRFMTPSSSPAATS
jgi:hypothetical protein